MSTHACLLGSCCVGINILFKYCPDQAIYRCFFLELAVLCRIYPGVLESRICYWSACHECCRTNRKAEWGFKKNNYHKTDNKLLLKKVTLEPPTGWRMPSSIRLKVSSRRFVVTKTRPKLHRLVLERSINGAIQKYSGSVIAGNTCYVAVIWEIKAVSWFLAVSACLSYEELYL